MCISGQPEGPYTLNDKEAKLFLISSLMKQVLESPNKSTMINDWIENFSQTSAEQVDYFPASYRDSETHGLHCSILGRDEVSKCQRSCSMPIMLSVSKTRRDMLYLWYHATSHYRGGRATNQQSIHHVRHWNSQVNVEGYFKGSTLWALCSSKK